MIDPTYAVPVLRRLTSGIRPVDRWLALAFVGAAGVEAVIRYRHDSTMLVTNLLGAPIFGCLAWRRRNPLLTVSVMTVIFSAGSVAQALLAAHKSNDEVVPIFALLIVSYSLGAFASQRQLWWGAWQPVLLVVVVDASEPNANSLISATLFITIFISAAPMVAGRLVRGRTALVQRLREQAAEIDAQRSLELESAVAAERLRMAQHFHESLIIGMQSLVSRTASTDAGATLIGEIERGARELLAQTREEVVALTAPIPDTETPADTPAEVPQPLRLGDAAQPWTVLAGGALCAGLLVETRTLPLDVPSWLAGLACVGLAAPLALAWLRPVLAICALWVGATLFSRFVAPLDDSFTAIALSFVPPFLVAALVPRRWALVGLAASMIGGFASFGPSRFAGNGAIMICCWIAGAIFFERTRLVERLRANNRVLDEHRAAAATRAVVGERLRVARELHDAVGHSLTIIALQAGAARRIAASDPARAEEVMQTIRTVARDGLAELEAGSTVTANEPDTRSIDDLLRAARAAGLQIDVRMDDVTAHLTPEAVFAMYRVVQEALTNVLKHAPAANASLSLRATGRQVELVVVNSAPRAAVTAAEGGRHGLRGMKARVEACGGHLTWDRQDDGGFEVRAQLPAATVVS